MTQDFLAVLSIIDAILARLRLELPTVTSIFMLSDNARCYQNDILTVAVPYITKEHGIFLSGIVHSETQRGKSLLDAHFAIAMMHVNLYCRETRRDVTTPGDIVVALNSFKGVANCTGEMVHISREHEGLKKWLEAKKTKHISALDRVNEVLYAPWNGEEITANCYKLSGREETKYQFNKFRSQKLNTTVSISQNLESENQEPELDAEEDEEVQNETQSMNADEGFIDHIRPSEVEYKRAETGVLVWSRSRLRKQRKRRKNACPVMDEIQTQADILAEDQSCVENSTTVAHNNVGDTIQPVLQECPTCGKGYRRVDFYDAHFANCNGPTLSMQICERASRMAFDMLKNSELSIYTTKTKYPAALTITVGEEVIRRFPQAKGWAQRPTYGKTLGNTVHRFANDIKELFESGQIDKGKKMNASITRDVLRKKYPQRYDVPSEYFITAFVATLVRKHKKAVQYMNKGGTEEPRSSSRSLMPSTYVASLTDLVSSNDSLMPRMARDALISSLNLTVQELPADFPTDKAIRAKESSLRMRLNRASQVQ